MTEKDVGGKKGMSGAELHSWLREVVNETPGLFDKKEKCSESSERVSLKNYENHVGDFFHPENIFNKTRNFPTCPSSANAARLGAENIVFDENEVPADIIDEEKHKEAAKLLLLSQANTFQHKVLLQYGKKLMKKAETDAKRKNNRDINDDDKENGTDEDEELFEEKQKRLMLFESFDKTGVIENLSMLPTTWSIVQISGHDPLVTRFKKTKSESPINTNPNLTVVSISAGKVRVSRCQGPPSDNCLSYMKEFTDIIEKHKHVNKNPPMYRGIYDKKREELNDRLKSLLKSMEDSWLGYEKVALIGSLKDESQKGLVASVIEKCVKSELQECQMSFLTSLLSSTPFLTDDQMMKGLTTVLPSVPEDEMLSLTKTARSDLQSLASAARNPVIMILDSNVQSLPWESLPSLRQCCQPASRVPSLPYLYALWTAHAGDNESVVSSGVAQDSVFYVVNPDKSLPETEKKLGNAFKAWSSWEGVLGEVPQKEQLQNALQGKDAFIYAGHGSGSKYLSCEEVERLKVGAVPLLLGCSSGQLVRMGRTVDPIGVSQSYLIAASPALVGFLWAVTDRDVDKWTVIFLEHWLRDGGQEELLQAVADKRENFQHFINGAALVVYGLPLKAKRD